MPNSKSLMAYTDVKEILDRALASKGLELSFNTKTATIRWVSRANSFRILDRRNNKKLYPEAHSLHDCSPYDTLIIKRVTDLKVTVAVRAFEGVEIKEL